MKKKKGIKLWHLAAVMFVFTGFVGMWLKTGSVQASPANSDSPCAQLHEGEAEQAACRQYQKKHPHAFAKGRPDCLDREVLMGFSSSADCLTERATFDAHWHASTGSVMDDGLDNPQGSTLEEYRQADCALARAEGRVCIVLPSDEPMALTRE